MSYSSVAGARKNHGSAASTPITIGSHTPQAKATTDTSAYSASTPVITIATKSAAQPAAAKPSVASSSAPVNWASHFTTAINNLALKQNTEIAAVRAEFQAVTDMLTTNMNVGFAQMMEVLQGRGQQQVIHPESPAPNTTSTVEQEDIDIPEVTEPTIPDSIIVIPDSMPSTPAAAEPFLSKEAPNDTQGHSRSEPSLAKNAPYSVTILRPHPSGESSAAKTDYYQLENESEPTRKGIKGKETKRDTPQETTSVLETSNHDLGQRLDSLQKTIDSMAALIQGLRDDLAQQRAENRRLKDALAESMFQSADGGLVYHDMTTQEVNAYTEVAHHGSGNTHNH